MEGFIKKSNRFLYVHKIVYLGDMIGGINIKNSKNTCKYLSVILNRLFCEHIIDFEDLYIIKSLIESEASNNTIIALRILETKCKEYRNKMGFNNRYNSPLAYQYFEKYLENLKD